MKSPKHKDTNNKTFNNVVMNHSKPKENESNGAQNSATYKNVDASDGKHITDSDKDTKEQQPHNQQRKKIWDSPKQLLHPLKPDLLPPGSPARKRIRSSRSNSRTLSFICLDAAENSDDDDNREERDNQGKLNANLMASTLNDL